MNSPFGWQIFEGKDQAMLTSFVEEARGSAMRALSHIDMSDPETLATFDHLVAQASAQSTSIASVLLDEGISITTPVAGLYVMNRLHQWDSEVASSFHWVEDTLRLFWEPAETTSGEFESRVFDHTLAGVGALAALDRPGTVAQDAWYRAADNFQRVAIELDQAGHLDTALACGLSATNLATALSPSYAESPSNLALSIARRTSDEEHVAQLAARHAHLLGQIARTDQNRRLDAFDAFDDALRQLPSDRDARKAMATVFESWLTLEDYLKPLMPMLYLTLRSAEPGEIPIDPDDVTASLRLIWEGTSEEWFDRISAVVAVSTHIENARLTLFPEQTELDPHTSWSTRNVEHPKLLHAVPHGTSILREEFLDSILLELNHETTHVYSMFGFVGTALITMRWALFELELELWALTYMQSGQEPSEAFFEEPAPAPLEEAIASGLGRVAALAQAEQAIEVERKIQLLENTWAPWFEGIAVFGELAADPRIDPEWASPVGEVISNLWDRNIYSEAQELGISTAEVLTQDRLKAEALYGEAIDRNSAPRLRTYLITNHQKYLAGYLAVRTVVSAWRSTLGRPIRGDQAFRVLLHLTRYSDFSALPDLGLPLEAFREAVITHHMKWLRDVASASKDDLDNIIGQGKVEMGPRASLRWVEGRLVGLKTNEEEMEQFRQNVETLLTQTLSSMRGDRADVDRVVDADDDCRTTMHHTAEALKQKAFLRRVVTFDEVEESAFRLTILPLGRVDCPFWLLERDRRIACLVRTRERESENGSPSYDVFSFTLNEEEYESLRDEVLRSGAGRRMVVTRVVNLARGVETRLPEGTNFIVFQYGDWMHIQPRGLIFGAANVEPWVRNTIKSRLSPRPALAFQEQLMGETHACARRTAQWVEVNDWNLDISDDLRVDVGPWANRVQLVAEQILSNNISDVHAVSQHLLDFVMGDSDIAAVMAERGLLSLYDEGDEGPGTVTELIRMLDDTARGPVEDSPEMEHLSQTVGRIIGPLIERISVGWDVVRPRTHRDGRLPYDEHNSDS